MKEDGFNEGARRVGTFFLALIPWAVGIGAIAWVSVLVSVHEYRQQAAQEQRRAVYVGSGTRPKAKLKIEVPHKTCIDVERADIDGANLVVYLQNNCGRSFSYMEVHVDELSPDRTILYSWYDNGVLSRMPVNAGDKVEVKVQVDDDPRAATIAIWTKTGT